MLYEASPNPNPPPMPTPNTSSFATIEFGMGNMAYNAITKAKHANAVSWIVIQNKRNGSECGKNRAAAKVMDATTTDNLREHTHSTIQQLGLRRTSLGSSRPLGVARSC